MKRFLDAVLRRAVIGDFFDRRAKPKLSTESKGDDLLDLVRVVLPGVASALIATTDAISRFFPLALFSSKIVDTLFLVALLGFCLYWLCSRVSVPSDLFPARSLLDYRYSQSRRLASKLALVTLPLFIGANLCRLTPNAVKAYFDEDARSLCGYVCNASESAISQENVELWDEFGNRAADIVRTDDIGLVCFKIRGASFTPKRLTMQTPACSAPVEHKVDTLYEENEAGCPVRTEEGFSARVWVVACAK
ncbi:hypothetical protein D7Y13_17475 [Corallococcus praedator]|uniref:RDD domain-containing protein n=1 Tax=Corallococcus praedator TaxID=2316724 RepID=A0ABX9QGX2_9BACT|nr:MULTISPECIES: hypothetical protein [Corallococcus]RKH35691.1 hypothetical protein D7X75_03690 [Corallococcus sp. CA031C]RKI07637.1 hypothetical protein D7Y13_17475 [Corallococcus praedator]